MKIKIRLLVLIAILIIPLIVNLLILGSLTYFILRSSEDIRAAAHQQTAALQMRAQLRDAEAALYRYQIEGEAGFVTQFENQLTNFEQEVTSLQSQSVSPEIDRWVTELIHAHQQAQSLGNDLISSRDLQTQDLTSFQDTVLQIELLLSKFQNTGIEDLAYGELVNKLFFDIREIAFTIASYLVTPKEPERLHFTVTAISFRFHLDQLDLLISSDEEETWSNDLETLFDEVETLGARLINRQDHQQNQFAQFAVNIFQLDQQTISGEIQPYAADYLQETQDNLATTLSLALIGSASASLLSVAVALLFAVSNIRHIIGGIQTLMNAADRIALGNFSDQVTLDHKDELQYLGDSFNLMMKQLAERQYHLQGRIAELEALHTIGTQLTSILDLSKVLQTIVDSTLRLLKASEVHIFLYNPQSRQPELKASAYQGNKQALKENVLYETEIVVEVMQTKQRRVLTSKDFYYHRQHSLPADFTGNLRASAIIPLLLADNILGVFCIILNDRSTFQSEELRTLDLLSDQAAVALENARLYQNLTDDEMRLQNLLAKLAIVQEEERRLVGLDLHDGLTQTLLSANMHLSTLSAIATDLDNQSQNELDLCQTRLQDAIAELRWVVAELRPVELEDFGLVDGLRQYIAKIAQHTGWKVAYSANLSGHSFDPAMETAIFRIVQEALSNTRKHAGTDRIHVMLQVVDDTLKVEVQDWGTGFDLIHLDEGDTLGLLGMRERAELFGGKLLVESAIGGGTCIKLSLPLKST